jgi:hypothetical protein
MLAVWVRRGARELVSASDDVDRLGDRLPGVAIEVDSPASEIG